ncbi:uncharacterized protein LOC119398569 [Rhipicephalus sanguineus]|uniref:uncharacterized protein LOC119398569 n=1 Tax=Rhipicephalus sanguineus TaxID=34632 RepID=UPI0020C320D6|nr:uncharacterized protein LOC119398569 [Rhipicephalus sanguineus]
MGDHVLLKWASEDKWDVYPVRNIKSQTVVCQLVDDPKYVTMLTNQTVQVLWQDDEYAAAYILGIGSQVAMERKRTRLVLGRASQSSPQDRSCGMQEELAMVKQELEESRARVGELAVELDNERAKRTKIRDKYNEAKELLDIKKMAKNLRKATSQLADAVSSVASPAPVTVPAAQVDIGDGVLLDKKLLERISLSTPTQPSKFARALLRAVFTVEELENSSLKGKVCPANNDAPPKKALDKRSLDAVVCKDT